MKLLFDENLSPRLARILQTAVPGSMHVCECELDAAGDLAIWNFAREHGFTIVSKDSDFNDLGLMLGCPPKVIWIKMGNCSTQEIADALVRSQSSVLAFDGTADTTLVIRRGMPS